VTLDLAGYTIRSGLINAHDHLEFNLFPRLGNGPYPNATAWSRDIYRPDESPIREQLRVPKRTRLIWGGLKNLLSGVTTVCHHNPYDAAVFENNFPVRVVKRFGWAHSLEFSPDLAERHRQTPKNWPFIVHLGEAADAGGRDEIFRLDEVGALDHRTVIVHGVALTGKGLKLARERGASLIWCPSSNRFLLGRTVNRRVLDSGIPVALGSDSALTATGDLLDEMREARLPAERLHRMVTTDAARILRLPARPRDYLALRGGDSPRLVAINGRVKLASPELFEQLPAATRKRLRRLHVEGREPVMVDADVPALYRDAAKALGPDVRLAGRRIIP
jgi:cytosine/adenosine deaminase-related metal-dependent hydrolase